MLRDPIQNIPLNYIYQLKKNHNKWNTCSVERSCASQGFYGINDIIELGQRVAKRRDIYSVKLDYSGKSFLRFFTILGSTTSYYELILHIRILLLVMWNHRTKSKMEA